MTRHIISILIVLALVGCGGSGKTSKTAEQTRSVVEEISPAELLKQRVDHYWDGFDFEAGERVKDLNREDVIYAMSEYVTIIPAESADSLMRALIRRASTSHDMLDYFATVCEIVLHNPNSPLRNDEYYIPVLEELASSPLLDEYERIAPAYDLDIARKNRIGRVANNFVYTLEDDSQGELYDIKANYTILMFSNPECPLCGEIMRQIASSQLLSVLMQHGVLKVLTIYPDEDVARWRKYIDNIPAEWIRAYDKGQIISKERLYNLSAIPALYLLDKEKRVIIKDGTSVADIESVLMRN
ncbi:MAG: DUF5106 domain-containing protein [Alistipes sp.]|nr:DUF5106 domain-containing protein [Alistipes sp.]